MHWERVPKLELLKLAGVVVVALGAFAYLVYLGSGVAFFLVAVVVLWKGVGPYLSCLPWCDQVSG